MPFKNVPQLYTVWQGMKRRCLSPGSPQYDDYGGRGITICERWVSNFSTFASDMGERPKGYSLERKDNNGNYEPGNCKWASKKEQQNNRRMTKRFIFNGGSYLLTELAEKSGHKADTILERIAKGMTFEDVIFSGKYKCTGRPDKAIEAAILARKVSTHCKNKLHLWTEENTGYTKEGTRVCKSCYRRRRRLKLKPGD